MDGRLLLFGATGYTGRLTAAAMARAGQPVVLVSRSADRVQRLADELAPLVPDGRVPQTATADAADPASVRALLAGSGDVLVSTVGPFLKHGQAAVTAAIEAGAAYVDSTGESPFIRWVFQQAGPEAARTGARLLPAFAYDYVPGNLAGALALQGSPDHGGPVVRLEIGYFVPGGMGMSSGTRASVAGVLVEESHAFRNGRLVLERAGRRTAQFDDSGRRLFAASVGASEQFALPRLSPTLREVDVYLGWAGTWTKTVSALGAIGDLSLRLPGARALARRAVGALAGRTTGQGPDDQQRAQSSTLVLARAFDATGACVHQVRLIGPTPYELTADLLAWGAQACLEGKVRGTGALGPVDAFGVDEVIAGCARAGLVAQPPS
jgi:short subunit dehydrogenase-like uncharacterized protein